MSQIILVNIVVVLLVVGLHYEFLRQLSDVMSRFGQRLHRPRILLAVVGTLIANTIQVWVFALAYYLMHQSQGWGYLSGNFSGSLLDCAYYSFTAFTTLGFGDIEPFGAIRYLTGIEALTGLTLITWSASFLFVEMQRYWPTR